MLPLGAAHSASLLAGLVWGEIGQLVGIRIARLACVVVMAALAVGLSADLAAAQEAADLQITKVVDQKTVKIGETITYTIT
jgi:hypothetical protein